MRNPVLALATLVLFAVGGSGIVRGQSSGAPDLNLEVINEQTVKLTWQHAAPGFILQNSESTRPVGQWLGVPQAPALNGGERSVTVALPSSYTRWFFRLRARGVYAGLDYLVATQDAAGSWGDPYGTGLRDTAAAVEALNLYGQNPDALALGTVALFARSSRNNDELARKAVALEVQGQDISVYVDELLAAQGAATGSPSSLAFPGRGWGLGAGFGSSTIDTALVLRALKAQGLQGGLAVAKEQLAPSATSPPHPFSVPAGASGLLLKVQSVTGGTLRFNLTTPSSGTLYVDVAPASAPITITGLPSTLGNWTLQVENQSGATASYSAEIAFTDAGGFDFFRVTSPLLYLGLAQNPDGGWGIARDEDSHLMITTEVLMTLAGWGSGFVGPQALAGGATWLFAHQNPDGGFSSVSGPSNLNETALAMLALRAVNPGISLGSAAAWLREAQLPDGSWGNNPFVTAMVLKSLHLGPVVGPIPDQTVIAPDLFAQVLLDDYVADPDHADGQMSWAVTGNSQLTVTVVDRVATITYPPSTTVSEPLTFTATDPDGLSGSATASFTVNFQPVDYTIARGGNATGTRTFSGAESVLDQAAFYTESQIGLPPGMTYTLTAFTRISAVEFEVGFQIAVGAGAATGIQSFQVEYGLRDASNQPLGPLTGNVFNFSIKITP